jgi:hypothetical protein
MLIFLLGIPVTYNNPASPHVSFHCCVAGVIDHWWLSWVEDSGGKKLELEVGLVVTVVRRSRR